jgi:hypothetical protein
MLRSKSISKANQDKKDLFSTLKTSYELYAGSEENLKKLVSTGDISKSGRILPDKLYPQGPQAPL